LSAEALLAKGSLRMRQLTGVTNHTLAVGREHPGISSV